MMGVGGGVGGGAGGDVPYMIVGTSQPSKMA